MVWGNRILTSTKVSPQIIYYFHRVKYTFKMVWDGGLYLIQIKEQWDDLALCVPWYDALWNTALPLKHSVKNVFNLKCRPNFQFIGNIREYKKQVKLTMRK